jgi:hypothetical protein
MPDQRVIEENRDRRDHPGEEHQQNEAESLGVITEEEQRPNDCRNSCGHDGEQVGGALVGVFLQEHMHRDPEDERSENGGFRGSLPRSEEQVPSKNNHQNSECHERRVRFEGRCQQRIRERNEPRRKQRSEERCEHVVRRLMPKPPA